MRSSLTPLRRNAQPHAHTRHLAQLMAHQVALNALAPLPRPSRACTRQSRPRRAAALVCRAAATVPDDAYLPVVRRTRRSAHSVSHTRVLGRFSAAVGDKA